MDADMKIENGNMIRGENYATAFSTTDSPCIDLFFSIVPGSNLTDIGSKLKRAWEDEPVLALKIIFNFGNVRKDGGGKQDAINFCRAMIWMWENHPKTLLLNLDQIPEHASLKLLLDVCMYILHKNIPGSRYNLDESLNLKKQNNVYKTRDSRKIKWKGKREAKKLRLVEAKNETELKETLDQINKQCQQTKILLKSKNDARDHLKKQYDQAPNACQLRDNVATIFAKGLAKEFRQVFKKQNVTYSCQNDKNKQPDSIGGLYAKWAPTKGKSHDKAIKLVHTIIPMLLLEVQDLITKHPLLAERKNELLHLAKLQSENVGKSIAHLYKKNNTLRCLAENTYQKMFLANIRGATEVPEHFVGTNQFSKVNYHRMPSRCRLLFGKKVFAKHDKEGYEKFLWDAAKNALLCKKGAKINIGDILPHELTTKTWLTGVEKMKLNLQWLALVESMKDKLAGPEEKNGHWLPLCDVSESMNGTPMEVAIALSLLMAESSCTENNIWGGKIMTFEERPSLYDIDGIPKMATKQDIESVNSLNEMNALLGDLQYRVSQIRGLRWGGRTNVELAFDKILEECKKNAYPPEKVANFRLCIFSHMEFDQARGGRDDTWEIMHDVIEQKFRDAHYPVMPTIVYWNLRASKSTPINDTNKPGVALLSGYSAGLMRKFLSGQLEDDEKVEEEEEEGVNSDEEENVKMVKVKEAPTAMETLLKIVDGELYEKLQVADEDFS